GGGLRAAVGKSARAEPAVGRRLLQRRVRLLAERPCAGRGRLRDARAVPRRRRPVRPAGARRGSVHGPRTGGEGGTGPGMKRLALFDLRPEAAAALRAGRPVVALESTLIAHGLPWPVNLETARAAEAAVREEGAVPATIAVWQGRPTVGLTDAELEELARADDVLKASRRDLATAVAQRRTAATTVAATMFLAHSAGIRLFATGGIGGAHRDAAHPWDVSADLVELARTPVAVVCAGAKSILDIPRTLEILETQGVPVVGYGTDEFP